MAKNFKLVVITPERIVFEREILSLIVPGEMGYLGVLADHAPLITTLKEGDIEITEPDGTKKRMKLGGGFMEVLNNTATILADSIWQEQT